MSRVDPKTSAALVLIAGLSTTPANAAHYVFTKLTVDGMSQAMPLAINNNGLVVGYVTNQSTGETQGFVWQNGAASLVPGSDRLNAVNNKGLAVGECSNAKANCYVLYNVKSGKLKTFHLPVRSVYVAGINDSGVIAGDVSERHAGTQLGRSALITGRTYRFVAPDGSLTATYAINDSGEVVGKDILSQVAFIYKVGTYTLLNVPGAQPGYGEALLAISNAGIGVGYYNAHGYYSTGFVYDGSTYSDVAFPGALGTFPTGFGSYGEVVGDINISGKYGHGFIERAGKYHQIDYPGASSTFIDGANARGTLIGEYTNGASSGVFIAQCSNGISCTH